MDITQLLLQTKLPDNKPLSNITPDTFSINQETKHVTPPSTNRSRDYLQEFRQKQISKLIAQWLNSKNPNKKVFSATEVIECPKQTWYKLKGKITKDMLDLEKFFYLVDVYARMGDTVHNYIYKTLEFQFTEKKIVDEENHISGKYDIYDNGTLIDIKSSLHPYDVSPQLSVYYYLVTQVEKLPVQKVYVWWVLKDKLEEYDIENLKILYPKYLHRAKSLYTALKYDNFPESLGTDEKSCKYCPLESWCKGKTRKVVVEKQNTYSQVTQDQDLNKKDDIIFLL